MGPLHRNRASLRARGVRLPYFLDRMLELQAFLLQGVSPTWACIAERGREAPERSEKLPPRKNTWCHSQRLPCAAEAALLSLSTAQQLHKLAASPASRKIPGPGKIGRRPVCMNNPSCRRVSSKAHYESPFMELPCVNIRLGSPLLSSQCDAYSSQ